MENQTISSKSIILNYGLFYGIASIIFHLVLYSLGMHLENGTLSIILSAAFVIGFPVLGIAKFKKGNDNILSWGQAVKIGIGIVVLGILIALIYQHIFQAFIEPDFINQLNEVQRQGLIDAGLTDEQIEAQMKITANFTGTVLGSAVGLLFFTFVGFVISAIAGAIMKRSGEEITSI